MKLRSYRCKSCGYQETEWLRVPESCPSCQFGRMERDFSPGLFLAAAVLVIVILLALLQRFGIIGVT
ncbi:MAG: hypothetical protein IPK87_13470 [Planctomycetes bacterium]|nr:hypothetical protein [Planctomycetota bacterium]